MKNDDKNTWKSGLYLWLADYVATPLIPRRRLMMKG